MLKNAAEVARFAYDPMGRRVEKVAAGTTTTWAYDGEDILREVSGATTLKYVHGPGIDEPLAREDGAGALSFFQADGLGSVVITTNPAGAVTGSRRYDSFGNLELGQTNGYAYTGREWDSEIDLYYYRARYYDPRLGRFASEDPIAFRGGLNFFAYVGDNPSTWRDPSGLQIASSDNKSFWPRPTHNLPPDPSGDAQIEAFAAERRNFDRSIDSDPFLGGFRHCMAARLLKRRYGFIGNLMVSWWDFSKEPAFMNPLHPQGVNSESDMAAERHGLKAADGCDTCENECLQIYRPRSRGGNP